MREILFRGKTIDGNWVQGAYVHYDDIQDKGKDDCDYIVEKHNGENFPFVKVVPETIGQYTGLKDKNGTKIFEGDIINFDKYATEISDNVYVIMYDVEIASFIGMTRDNCSFTTLDNDSEYIEVIGNIHDNPELLREV